MKIKCTECGTAYGIIHTTTQPEQSQRKEETKLLGWLHDHVMQKHFIILENYQKTRKLRKITNQDIYVRFGELT